MSDLQDVIAANAIRAYNEGLDRGAAHERERIIELLDSLDIQFLPDANMADDVDYVAGDALDLIELIRGK
jgi:hypothetical protein